VADGRRYEAIRQRERECYRAGGAAVTGSMLSPRDKFDGGGARRGRRAISNSTGEARDLHRIQTSRR
jgi:hypothetical protein